MFRQHRVNLLRKTLQNPQHCVLHRTGRRAEQFFSLPTGFPSQCGLQEQSLSISISSSPHAMNIEIPEPFISLAHRGQGTVNSWPQKASAGVIELLELLQSCLGPLKGPDRQGGEVRGGVHHLPNRINPGDKIRTRSLLSTETAPCCGPDLESPDGSEKGLGEVQGRRANPFVSREKGREQDPFRKAAERGIIARSPCHF